MDTQKELIAQKIELEYNQRKANPKLAWLNLLGWIWAGGIGYYATAKGDKDMITKGVMWTLAAFFTSAIVTTFGWLYLSVDFMGIALYIWMIFDSYFLMKKVEEKNVNLKKEITERINSEVNGNTKEESYGVNKVVAEEAFVDKEANEPSKTAETKSRMTEEEFQNMVVTLNNDRVRNGYEPLPVSKFDYIDYIGKENKKD